MSKMTYVVWIRNKWINNTELILLIDFFIINSNKYKYILTTVPINLQLASNNDYVNIYKQNFNCSVWLILLGSLL